MSVFGWEEVDQRGRKSAVLPRGYRRFSPGGLAGIWWLLPMVAAGWVMAGGGGIAVGQQDTPEDQQAHAEEDGLPGPGAGSGAREKAGGEFRPRMEGEEELPAEFEPDQVVPFDQSRLGLPGWQEAERLEILRRQRPANQGGGLFPAEIWPIQPVPAVPVLKTGSQEHAAAPLPTGMLSQPVLDLYFARRPDRVFCDPQGVLPPGVREEMESRVRRWLNTEGPFRATVLLFGPGQQLPPAVDAQSVLNQWVGDGAQSANHLLVFYYFNEPGRTSVVFSEGTAARVPAAGLAEAMSSAARAAGRVEGGLPQLERFCYKTTVHLHRLAQVRPAEGGQAGRSSVSVWRMRFLAATGFVLAAVMVWILAGRGKTRKSRGREDAKEGSRALPSPVLLPEQDLYPRLNAPHAGGLASVISFPARKHE